MRKYFLLLLGLVVCLSANTKTGIQGSRGWEFEVHDTNQVVLYVSNFGTFGQNEYAAPGCIWPKGSGHAYIFGAGLWFGTIDSSTGDTLVTIGYGTYGGEREVVPGLKDWPITHPNAIIYMYPDNWPPPADTFPMAPQDTVSDQDSWCCYNDCDSMYHLPGDTRPIGIEIYQTVYPWDEPAIEDVVFMTFEVKNVSGNNLYDCYAGICTDCDVGDAADDQCTGIIERAYFIDGNLYDVDNIGYQFNENDNDSTWGAIGFDLLQTPFDLQDDEDKDNDGILDQYERDSAYYYDNLPIDKWDVDNDGVPDWRDASENPQLEMTALKNFILGAEPLVDSERYLTLAGYNFQTGVYEPYDTIIPTPADQRLLLSTGPFDLPVDAMITVTFAIVLADYGSDATPAAESCLVMTDHWAQWQYNMNWFLAVEEESSSETFNTPFAISPNPMSSDAKVSFSLPKSSLVSLKLYNVAGQLVRQLMHGHKSAGNYTVSIDTQGFAQGTYFLVLETPYTKSSRSLVVLR